MNRGEGRSERIRKRLDSWIDSIYDRLAEIKAHPLVWFILGGYFVYELSILEMGSEWLLVLGLTYLTRPKLSHRT